MEKLRIDYFSRFLEQHAAREVNRFLRPRGKMEKYYNVSILIFPIVSFFSQEQVIYRILMMLTVLFFYFASFLHPRISRKEKISYPNPAVHSWKLFVSWLIIITFIPQTSVLKNQEIPIINLSYVDIERWIACSVVLLGTWINHVKLPLLDLNKWTWISSVLKGYWYQSIVFLLLWVFDVFPKSIGTFMLPPMVLDVVIFLGILSNMTSYVVLQKSLSLEQLPKIAAIDPSIIFQKAFLVEMRDVGFVTTIFILLSTTFWNPYYFKEFWLFLGLTSFVIGAMLLITVFPGFSRDVSQLLIKDAENFECVFNSDEQRTITAISNALEELSELHTSISMLKRTYTTKKEVTSLEIFDFKDFKLTSSPKMVVPLQEIENGVLTVIIGEFAIVKKEKIPSDESSLSQLEEMIIQPQELTISRDIPSQLSIKRNEWKKNGYVIVVFNWSEWNRIRQNLIKFTVRRKKLIQEVLAMTNVESWDDLQSQIMENVLLFTRWNGPLEIFRTAETKLGTKNVQKTSLPGMHLVRSPLFALMNVLGIIKALIVPGGISYYKTPLITILDRSNDYFFIDTPFFSLLDTNRGDASKLLGFSVKSGVLSALNEADITSLLCKSSNQVEAFLEGMKKIINGKPLKFFFVQQKDGLRYTMIISSMGMLADVFRPHFYIRESRFLRHLPKINKNEIKYHVKENKEPLKNSKIDMEAAQLLLLHVPQCAICHRPVRKSSVICPFCGEEFCREEWLYYVFEKEQCPTCENRMQLPEKYRKILEKEG